MTQVVTSNTKHAVALTGLSSAIKPETQADLWIVYLPKGDRAVEQSAEDGTPTKLRVNPSALSAKRMEAARRLAAAKPNANQPYTDYNHDDKEASGRPLKFAWHDDLGVIGLTRRTLQAIERTTGDPPEFQAFSPHVPIDPETGEAVGIYMNCGGFVNRPLFGDATSLSAAAHLPQQLVAADPNEVELVSAVPDEGPQQALLCEGLPTPHMNRPKVSPPFTELIAKLCAHFQLDASKVTEPELIAAFEKFTASQPVELTAKAALRKPSDEEIGLELVGFAVGCGILAPAEQAEWERRLAKDRAGWTKELLAKAPSVLLGRVIQDQSAVNAAGGTKPKAKWELRVEELCAKDPLIAPIAAKDPARAKSIALERIAKEEPALLR